MKFKLNKHVFNKDKFDKTINTDFSEFKDSPQFKFFDLSLASINDFFTLYSNFFYEIPKYGDSNSHEYIIKTSNNYINIENLNDEMNDFIEEIDELRKENLQLRTEISGLTLSQESNLKSKTPSLPLSTS